MPRAEEPVKIRPEHNPFTDGFEAAGDLPGSVLLEAKLHPPTLFSEYVARPRLIQRLDAATTRPVTLVVAPTGYGKTTLLAAWCEHIRPCTPLRVAIGGRRGQ